MFIAAYDHVIYFTLLSFKQITTRWDETWFRVNWLSVSTTGL